MPAYLVRIEDTRDIVGFFFAETMEGLLDAVDECTDADGCEYVEMPMGIMWTSPAIPVPIDRGSDDPKDDHPTEELEDLPWARAELSESWWSVVYGYTDEQWVPFFPYRPRSPRPDPPKPRRQARIIPLRRRRDGGSAGA